MKGEKIYGVADRAWQCVIGCSPNMACAPRCWARRTVARVVECQESVTPDRAAFFQIALTPDRKHWSGEVRLDEAHLADPLKWRKPALIATGFHGDIGRLTEKSLDRIFQMPFRADQHRYLMLTKCPQQIATYLDDGIGFCRRVCGTDCDCWATTPGEERTCHLECECDCHDDFEPFPNVTIGCSVMNQAEADKYRDAMAQIAALGWNTHVWYEPAIGAVNWAGWEFLRGMISGGESGANSRPSHPQWHRDTRDWCAAHGVPYHFKQWGDWLAFDQRNLRDAAHWVRGETAAAFDAQVKTLQVNGISFAGESEGWAVANKALMLMPCVRVGKRRAARLLDGVTHDGVPAFGGPR